MKFISNTIMNSLWWSRTINKTQVLICLAIIWRLLFKMKLHFTINSENNYLTTTVACNIKLIVQTRASPSSRSWPVNPCSVAAASSLVFHNCNKQFTTVNNNNCGKHQKNVMRCSAFSHHLANVLTSNLYNQHSIKIQISKPELTGKNPKVNLVLN